MARSVAFHASLRTLGARLALDVLPPELLSYLRDHLDDIEELAVITSGETDIPWELVHVWAPDAGKDPDGLGFLGRAGLVRWVYNTRHPTSSRSARPRPTTSSPTTPTRSSCSTQAHWSRPTSLPFGGHGHRPAGRRGLARLITSGQVDLLHFAGHGLSNDDELPPVREMLLADYRRRATMSRAPTGRAWPSPSTTCAGPARRARAIPEPGPLVVLNACRIGQAPSTRSEVGGFAETFLRGGAGAFVGCLWSVGDQPARDFVEAFYQALDAGHTIAQATLAGRRAAREAGDLSWLAYTVYAHPDARLADRPTAAPSNPTPTGKARS